MSNLSTLSVIEKLNLYFSYSFVRYALIVAILISLCASLLGVSLVLKRYCFIGDGLSHVAFGAMAVSSILKLTNQSFLVMPITILVAILLLKTSENAKIKGDALIAMLSVGALAFGYLIMNVFSTAANVSGDVCTTLFGSTSILTLSKEEVIVCIVFSIGIIITYILFYNKIFVITFDENFSKASGIDTNKYNLLIAIIIAIIIVLGMNLVGSLLISALIIFPALSAMRVTENFKMVVIISAFISLICSVSGLIFSIIFTTPVGSTIVMANIIIFVLLSLLRKLYGA